MQVLIYTIDQRRKVLIEYAKMKIEERDWHALSDVANDLRELEIECRYSNQRTKADT